VGYDQTRRLLIVSDTGARPSTPRTRAAPGLRSITRPRTYGPRSLIRTVAERPLRWLTTVTMLPNGRVLCAAVMALGLLTSRGDATVVDRRDSRQCRSEVGFRSPCERHGLTAKVGWMRPRKRWRGPNSRREQTGKRCRERGNFDRTAAHRLLISQNVLPFHLLLSRDANGEGGQRGCL
jgi:hypothetical protein